MNFSEYRRKIKRIALSYQEKIYRKREDTQNEST